VVDVVKIINLPDTTGIRISGVKKYGATNSIKDLKSGVTLSEDSIGLYTVGNARFASGTDKVFIGGLGSSFGAIGFAATLTGTNYGLAGDGLNTLINVATGNLSFRSSNNTKGQMFPSGGLYWGITPVDPGQNNARIEGTLGVGATSTGPKLSLGTDLTAQKLAIYDGTSDFWGFGVQGGRIVLHTTNTERMAFHGSGGVSLGTTTDPGVGNFLVNGNLQTKSGTSFTGTLDHAITADRTWTLPDATGTVGVVLSATASLDFTLLAANSCEAFTVTVTGAADGNPVSLGIPNSLADVDGATERTVFFAWVSAADTVSVRRCNVTGAATADPAPATVRVDVRKP